MKPTFDRKRALSWSAISSFEYNKEQWYQTYVLGERQSSPEMTFGSKIDKLIQEDLNFLPELPRYPFMQYKMNAKLGKIPLVGIPDGICFKEFLLADYKTGKVAWDQKRADETGQLTHYLFLIYKTEKIKPEKFRCFIHWIPTQKNEKGAIEFSSMPSMTFETKRTMKDLVEYGVRINCRYKEMINYCEKYTEWD